MAGFIGNRVIPYGKSAEEFSSEVRWYHGQPVRPKAIMIALGPFLCSDSLNYHSGGIVYGKTV